MTDTKIFDLESIEGLFSAPPPLAFFFVIECKSSSWRESVAAAEVGKDM